jgi:hypothetical protein
VSGAPFEIRFSMQRPGGFMWCGEPSPWDPPRVPWYLRPWEPPKRPIAALWYCTKGEPFGDDGHGRVIGPYCGAPLGVRCSCGAQLHGHDPGDEA